MIGLIMASAGALLIGLVIGHTWGEKSGYAAGAKTVSSPLSPSSGGMLPPISFYEKKLPRYHFIHRLSVVSTPEERMRQSTYAVKQMCDKIAKQLLADRIIRPVILEENGSDGSHLVIGCSLYAVADPSYECYPNLTFFERPLTPD